MTYTRQNAWTITKSDGTWPNTILWYARAVADMQNRPLTDPTGWRFYAAIHGFDPDLWSSVGYFQDGESLPGDAVVNQYWRQCQHGTWYFLPWHRGYLLTFEAVVRAAIVRLGGPADWALPYWNYFANGEADIPPAFASTTWPDGATNPLFIQARFGPNNDGNITIPTDQVNLDPMSDQNFIGTFNQGAVGFGGPVTKFSHSGNYHGGVESQPHDMTHVCIGGFPPKIGLMSDPTIAALDPIFWLHHANIDRLWEVWRNNPTTNQNPSDPHWLGGPVTYGDRKFSTPDSNGNSYDYTPADEVDIAALGYGYDDLTPAAPPITTLAVRIGQLGGSAARIANVKAEGFVPRLGDPELIGANSESIAIAGDQPIATTVALAANPRQRLITGLNQSLAEGLPDRVFLNLENVTGLSDGSRFKVLISVVGADPESSNEYVAGTIGLFGVRRASLTDDEHAGQGISYSLDITNIVDEMHVSKAINTDSLQVSIVPIVPVPAEAQIRIGRISVYRQPQSAPQ